MNKLIMMIILALGAGLSGCKHEEVLPQIEQNYKYLVDDGTGFDTEEEVEEYLLDRYFKGGPRTEGLLSTVCVSRADNSKQCPVFVQVGNDEGGIEYIPNVITTCIHSIGPVIIGSSTHSSC